MAKIINNNFTRGISGKVGNDMIFSQKNGRTFIGIKGERRAPYTEKQLSVQIRFKEATIYGKSMMNDAISQEEYQFVADALGTTSAYTVAVSDFLRAPEITNIDLTRYSGKVGDKITVRAVDDFRVTGVFVAITNPEGTLIESGEATPNLNGVDWEYTATVANPTYLGDKIKVTAMDKPGNRTSLEQTL